MASRLLRCLTSLRGQANVKQSHLSLKKYFGPATAAVRTKSTSNKDKDVSSLIQPLTIKPTNLSDDINVGAELSGHLKKEDLLRILNEFYRRPVVKTLAAENGLDKKLFHQSYMSFRKFVVESEHLPVDLHIVLSDVLQGAGHVDDLFPYFLRHAREIFPHLDCMEDLKKISDLRLPANWYPEARGIQRKIIFHAGPTNSGKTHHALERFLTVKTGVYCGPLKLLASEVFHKSNTAGTPCDLVTGEERRYASEDNTASGHVACTVEMASVTTPYEVAIIDEIQMIKDPQRGWAWTRALLGMCAHEVHLCGEASAIDLVQELMMATGDEVEVRRYKRLTKLEYLDRAVEKFENVRPGDCIVCFSKNDIYYISRQLESMNKECAVIYGGLPPGTKLAQAAKFNNPNDPCKIMVATDAIGMGLNLAIKRIIFYSLMKPHLTESGEKEMDVISTSQALQIGGRAGRYNTAYENGEATTFRSDDLNLLKEVISRTIDPIEQAGLHPTAEQIELFAYHLPHATLSNLIDIFVTLSQLDSDKYFMCNVDDFKFLADMIEHVPLNLRVRYVFCCAPIPKKQPFVCTMFLKFARQFSRNEPLTLDWLCRQTGWPFATPSVIADLVHLEGVFDVLDLYLWLGYRFPDMFPDASHVRDMQAELDEIIQNGVSNITRLVRAAEDRTPGTMVMDSEDDFFIKHRRQKTAGFASEMVNDGEDELPVKQSLGQKYKEQSFSSDSAYDSRLSASFLQAKNARQRQGRSVNDVKVGQGRLASQLIKEGLITPEVLAKLQAEWQSTMGNGNGEKASYGNDSDGEPRRPFNRRGRR
ncbi:ATP-dependent RNA helicase SUPV3L1, mitochondrial-like [Babylonia areolata]|uniref:ATP-dependent RNA helicase SUPV3L1, mitochondrial-like n=1 Tax=Babylonia areolata TaxID=304850 RepID=UPI003FD423AB